MTREPRTLLDSICQKEDGAAEALLPLVYEELRRLADGYLRGERVNHTLQPTALVHEAYVKLIGEREEGWEGRSHFVGVAALAMRRLLADHHRRRNAQKRGGGLEPISLHSGIAGGEEVEFASLDAALERLAKLQPRVARIVELRFFGGLTIQETATLLDVSTTTVENDWAIAKAWLSRELDTTT